MSNQTATEQFRTGLRGELIEPNDGKYESARKVYNGMIDKRPRLIARCADVADVIAAVNFGRENGLLIAVRGGGHNAAGLGICDDALVIDLSSIRYIRVDPKTKTVRVGGGCPLGRCRSRHARVRTGRARRHHLDDGRGRPDAWRRAGVSHAQIRPDHRQPAGGRHGAGRRKLRHGQREGASRPVLGDPRRRRELRHRHFLPVQGSPASHRLRRADALASRRCASR